MAFPEEIDSENRAPANRVHEVSYAQLRDGGLYAYTAINAPLGLRERIHHVWLQDGQEVDRIDAAGTREDGSRFGDARENWAHVAGPEADAATLDDLEFAWRAVRAVKSNAILLAKDGASVGVGMGQVNRLDSAKLAVERANTLGAAVTGSQDDVAGGAAGVDSGAVSEERARGAVAASDAFFPFADGLNILVNAGVKAVIAPGGSIRDHEVIAAADAAGVPLYFTGTRHFFH